MPDNFQQINQFEQIEQQVSQGLPPSGPRILSQEPVNNKKNLFINILLALGIVSLGTLSVILVVNKTLKKNQIAQISPTPAVITLKSEYSNPFDENTQYTNPFSEKINPFDNISQ